MSTPSHDRIQTPKRPLLAALLQLTCLLGGLGYGYLGQWAKLGITFVVIAALQGANVVSSTNEWKVASMVLGPVIMLVLVLTLYDAWLLAKILKGGGSIGKRETRLAVLGWIPGFELPAP